MADVKKSSGPQTDAKTIEQITFLLAGLLLLGAIATAILNFIDSLGYGGATGLWDHIVNYFLTNIWPKWKFIAALLSAFAFAGIIYNSYKRRVIDMEESEIFDPPPLALPPDQDTESIEKPENERWERIVKHSNSDNPSDWKQAILEADVMLEELLKALGYTGDSLGERLKSVEKSDFLTIESAWEAHKVRNAIAHSRGDFQLNARETKRVIGLFEQVFKEFDII